MAHWFIHSWTYYFHRFADFSFKCYSSAHPPTFFPHVVSMYGGFLQARNQGLLLSETAKSSDKSNYGTREGWLRRCLFSAPLDLRCRRWSWSQASVHTLTHHWSSKRPRLFFFLSSHRFIWGRRHALLWHTYGGRSENSCPIGSLLPPSGNQTQSLAASVYTCQAVLWLPNPALILGIFFTHIPPCLSPSRAVMGLVSSFLFIRIIMKWILQLWMLGFKFMQIKPYDRS